MNGEYLNLAPDYETWLHSVEPIRHPERLVHAAILLLAGDDDPVIAAALHRDYRGGAASGLRRGGRARAFLGAARAWPRTLVHAAPGR
jgi:hypothetical protein